MGTFVAEAGTDVSVGGGGERAKSVVGKAGEADYVYKSNGNPDSQQVHENGDGDLPSFSIKRLRRLPLRVACEQQQQQQQPPPPPTVDRSWPEEAADGNVVENVKQRQPDGAHSCGGRLPEQEQEQEREQEQKHGFSDLTTGKDDAMECIPGAIDPELENGKYASEEAELRNPGGGEEAGVADGPDLSRDISSLEEEEKQTGNGSGQEKKPEDDVRGEEIQTGNGLGQETSEESKAPEHVAAPEHALDSSNALIGESGNTSTQSHEARANSKLEQLREDASPGTSDPPSSSAGLNSVAENVKHELVEEDSNRDDKEKASEETNLELSSPGIVQILPPVMGNRFESPGETTDEEETDSPQSSEGFAYPGDSDNAMAALPYSGQILYPSRFSSAQTANGPNILQYSGSMSLRSDSSTTSNRSFAFPILAPPEWNSSPVRMAKAHPRRKNRFEGCCFFRLSRIRNKY